MFLFQGVNVAKNGIATESSLAWGGLPTRAIDGNLDSIWSHKSCTHTKAQTKPWWRLDLRNPYKVNYISITNRKDCCSERLNGAEIRIGNSLNDEGNSNPRWVIGIDVCIQGDFFLMDL